MTLSRKRKANAAYVHKDPALWKNAGWTSVPNSIIRDVDIPPDEVWAWVWLASHDGDFEVSGRKLYEAKASLGRNRAYELLSALERRGLLLRYHTFDEEAQVPYVRYELQPTPVPEDQRTWEPSRAKPRQRSSFLDVEAPALGTAPQGHLVDNTETAGQKGFPDGWESAARRHVPGRAGIPSDQDFPTRPGRRGLSRTGGSRPSGNPYKEEKIIQEENPSLSPQGDLTEDVNGVSMEGGRDEAAPEQQPPSAEALRLVASLVFGRHVRPTVREAAELALLVDAACVGGLSLVEVKRHAQAKVNQAKTNAVSYLRRGLVADNLPVPPPVEAARPVPAGPGVSAERVAAIREQAGWRRGARYDRLTG